LWLLSVVLVLVLVLAVVVAVAVAVAVVVVVFAEALPVVVVVPIQPYVDAVGGPSLVQLLAPVHSVVLPVVETLLIAVNNDSKQIGQDEESSVVILILPVARKYR
jgi:hypothetical protein